MAMGTDGTTLYVGNTGGESLQMVDLDQRQVVGSVQFPPVPRQGGGNNANPTAPRALAVGLFGLNVIMSNGSQWKLVGNQATVRQADSITPAMVGGGAYLTMLSSPDNRYILTLAGSGSGYLYDSLSDTYIAGSLLFASTPTPIESYYGLLAVSPDSNYLVTHGLVPNNSLTVIGGSPKAGNTPVTSPPAP